MALKVTSVSTPFFQLGSTASVFSLSKPCSFSKHPLRFNLNTRRKYSHPTSFVIRAARIESKGVTLGFRAPQFQVFALYCPFFYSFFHSNMAITMNWNCYSFQSLLLGRFGHWKILRLIQLYWYDFSFFHSLFWIHGLFSWLFLMDYDMMHKTCGYSDGDAGYVYMQPLSIC